MAPSWVWLLQFEPALSVLFVQVVDFTLLLLLELAFSLLMTSSLLLSILRQRIIEG